MSNTEKLKFAEIKHYAALNGLQEAQAQHDRAVEAGESADVLAVLKRNIREASIVLGDEGRELEFLRWCVAREAS